MIRKTIDGVEPPSSFAKYYEYMGGLGDVMLRLCSSPWYSGLDRLAPGERAAVVLMCHNPSAAQLFEWHPKISQIEVFDFGFGGHKGHPWDDPKWRAERQMPPTGPCPPPHDGSPIKFYPSPSDTAIIAAFEEGKFLITCPTAGPPGDRTYPPDIANEIVDLAIARGLPVIEIGSSHYLGRQYGPLRPRPGLISLVDQMSIPGTIELIRKARGIVTAHSFTLHAAWQFKKPVFLMYPKWVREIFEKHGIGGYFRGVDYPGTVHGEFSTYTTALFSNWGAL